MSNIISHLKQGPSGDWTIQSNDEHCLGVAELAATFASEFGMAGWGRLLGLLHDRGKESYGFQAYIKRASGFDSTAFSDDPRLHSLAGAILAHNDKLDPLRWLSNAIAGHHRGLYDLTELDEKLREPFPKGVSRELPDIKLEPLRRKCSPYEVSHIGRMLFSCLVDADWLDTERFMSPDKSASRSTFDDMTSLKRRLDLFCQEMVLKSPKTDLNIIRGQIQQACRDKSSGAPGFFNLTVPTGGGKTIASMVWAVNHAIKQGKRRIIVAIPYTSIIVQTARVLKKIFGAENVVEHHSGMVDLPSEEGFDNLSTKFATENWDAPIIVTTNVQLFESMFSNRPSSCRKLHSIVNSIVILDEVQTLPLPFFQPIVDVIKCYEKHFGVSFLFSTASQPILDGNRRGQGGRMFVGLPEGSIQSIVDPSLTLYDKLRRADININIEPKPVAAIAERIKREVASALCIVNTRGHARELYDALGDSEAKFHLSRMMCQAHILDTINEIRQILDEGDRVIKVVSTQLIEAGVDIDFPIVFRQLAGLDSILQAAGRCNREGRQPRGKTEAFQFVGEKPHSSISSAVDAMKDMLSLHPDSDWHSPAVMTEYYKKLYAKTESFDAKNIKELLGTENTYRACHYEEAAKQFHLIDDDGISVIVNYGTAPVLIEELREKGPSRSLSRRLGRYAVTINRHHFDRLRKAGLIEELFDGFYYIPFAEQYDNRVGLLVDSYFTNNTIII